MDMSDLLELSKGLSKIGAKIFFNLIKAGTSREGHKKSEIPRFSTARSISEFHLRSSGISEFHLRSR